MRARTVAMVLAPLVLATFVLAQQPRPQTRQLQRAPAQRQLAKKNVTVVDLRTGRCSAVEALVRWRHPVRGIIFPAVHLCRDSYTGMAFLLDRMAETGETVSALAGRLPRYHRRLGTLEYEHGRLGSVMQALERNLPGAAADRSDGLKLTWPSRWVHIRASNTEPLLRLAAEARSEEELNLLYGSVLRLLGR